MIEKKRIVLFIVVIIIALWSVFPIYWALNMSFMREVETLAAPPHWIPQNATLHNYLKIFGLAPLEQAEVSHGGSVRQVRSGLINSLIVAAVSSLLTLLVATLGGYAFGSYNFRFKNTLLFLFLSTQVIPVIALVLPFYLIFNAIGLVGTYAGLIISYLSINTPILTWVFVGFFSSLPKDPEMAARIDGCGRLKAMFRITFPMAASGIASIGILGFLMAWNEFLFALVLTGGSAVQTVQPALAGFFSQWSEHSLMSASLMLSLIPAIVVSLVLQKFITQIRIVDPVKLGE